MIVMHVHLCIILFLIVDSKLHLFGNDNNFQKSKSNIVTRIIYISLVYFPVKITK